MFKVIDDKNNSSENNGQDGEKLHKKAGLFIPLADPCNL
jgi:hypothetical protein